MSPATDSTVVARKRKRPMVLARLAAVACLAVGAAMPAAADAAPRIIGGQNVKAGAYPWMVALVDARTTDAAQGQFCGGQLISDTVVLTAAHCAEGVAAADVDVIADITDLSKNDGERMHVSAVAVHPQYDANTLVNDVAVLKLEAPSKRGRPIDVATAQDGALFAPGATVRTIGWGLLTDPAQAFDKSNTLMEVDVAMVSDADCAKSYGDAFFAESMLCAAAPGKDSCSGDSGGPLMAHAQNPSRWVLVGTVSWGDGCAKAGFPGVYSRIASLRSFVFGTRTRHGFRRA